MLICVLGELEVFDDRDEPVVITGAKQRALLAMLALHAGRMVPADRLVDALWGEDPPAAVRNGLQGLVSKLRRLLGSATAIVMRGTGYALEVPTGAVDGHRFEQLVADGRTALAGGDLAGAVALLDGAERLWRGPALADFADEDFAVAAATRWTELRLAAIEERIGAELQLGHTGVAAELETLVAAHPLRERLRGLLMVALYRSGRQAEALRVYSDGRVLLGEELGLDPDPELRRLEAAILAQDPALDGPTDAHVADPVALRRFSVPVPLTALLGRDAEVGELTALVDRHRLVTLVGPGGVGKTRLAVEVARRAEPALGEGACLVELAAVGDPAAVRGAIGTAIGITDPGQLEERIGDRELLIVLDNCEHVIAAAAGAAEALLRRCPHLRLVATSREGLRIGGEVIWLVPPLTTDDAASLFVARAAAAGVRLDPAAGATIADICARLDGLPLAVELAAARVRAFPPEQLLARLTERFRLLTGGSRTALPRQQTLRAVVDWSYDLLFDDEQRVFTRLSVFPGGCDLATAQAVCADDELGPFEVADIVQALVDKSLLTPHSRGDGVRFGELQTLAQYAREKLTERGEAEAVRDAMATRFAELCAGSAAAYIGDGQRAWLVALATEQDNVRAALEWAVANDDAERALTIAGGASWAHWLAGTAVEAKRWLDDAFACTGPVDDVTLAMARSGRALINFQLGTGQDVDADFEAALEVFRARGEPAPLAYANSFYAEVAAARGDRDEARRRRQDALAFYESLPDDAFVVAARAYSMAKLAVLDGDLAGAERCYRAATDGFARLDRPMMLAMCLSMVADFDERAGDHRAAIAALGAAIELNDALGLHGFNSVVLARLGWALLHVDDVAGSDAAYRRALALARRLGHRPATFLALTGLAVVHRLHGHDQEAADAAVEALDVHVAGSPRRLANRVDPTADVLTAAAACCAVLGCVAADRDRAEQAAALLGHAARLRTDAGVAMPAFLADDVARTVDVITATLGAHRVEAATRSGGAGRLGADVDFRR